jgi:hypothetical protein
VGFALKNPLTNLHNTVMTVGPTVNREARPATGSFRYNTDVRSGDGAIEVFDGTKWCYIGFGGLTPVVKDTFPGDAVTVTFTMTRAVATETDVVVFVGNIYQEPVVAYTVNGTTAITFTSPPPLKNTIVVLHGLNGSIV